MDIAFPQPVNCRHRATRTRHELTRSEPTVVGIFTCPSRGAPMVSREQVRAVRYAGIVGDRWYRPWWMLPLVVAKAWSRRKLWPDAKSVTLITLQEIERANEEMRRLGAEPMTLIELRRNLILNGDVDLNALIGKVFEVGGVRMRGDNPCTPCALPITRAERHPKEVKPFLVAYGHPKFNGVNRGGLRAQILTSGTISVGDSLGDGLPK